MIYVTIGRREKGKTTLARFMSRKVGKEIIFDPRGLIASSSPSVIVIHQAGESLDAIMEMISDPRIKTVVFAPYEDDIDRAFDVFIGHVKTAVVMHPDQPIALLIDEASFVDLSAPRFQWLAKCTRRDTFHILITAHRPSDVPTNIRAIADHWCIFATTQEHDIKAIEQRTSYAVVKEVSRLKGREYVHWDDAHGKMTIYRDPAVWFVSLSRTQSRVIEQVEPASDEFELRND